MPETVEQSRRTAQARHAAAVRWRKPNQTDTRRDLAYASLEDYIRRTVEAAPQLTDTQRDRLAALLRSSGGAAA